MNITQELKDKVAKYKEINKEKNALSKTESKLKKEILEEFNTLNIDSLDGVVKYKPSRKTIIIEKLYETLPLELFLKVVSATLTNTKKYLSDDELETVAETKTLTESIKVER